MVYTDICPILSDTEWKDNCQLPVIRKGETPSDWMKRIWDQLTNYKNNNRLTYDKKRYLIARKMEYLCGYECGFRHFMDKHWSTNCTGNAYCDISYKDYIELKSRSETSNSYFEKEAIRRYELWMQNAIRRVKHAREIGRKIRAVNVIQQKWLEYFYRPDGLCASELTLHYQLLWAVREEMRQ
ncbi:2779_t:CDS:2, partial [Entrophospora sp. SA101]